MPNTRNMPSTAENKTYDSLLRFVFGRQEGERLMSDPNDVWEEYLAERAGPSQRRSPRLSIRKFQEKPQIPLQTIELELGSDPISATSRKEFTNHQLQQNLRSSLCTIDESDVILSYMVATDAERRSATLLPVAEIRRRIIDIRQRRLTKLGDNDASSLEEYSHQVKLKLAAADDAPTRNVPDELLGPSKVVQPIQFSTCHLYQSPSTSVRTQPIPFAAPKPEPIIPATIPKDYSLMGRRRVLASGNKSRIVRYLRTLSPHRREIELKRLERKARQGTASNDQVARNSELVSTISGTLHRMRCPKRRSSDIQRVYRGRPSPRPVLARMSQDTTREFQQRCTSQLMLVSNPSMVLRSAASPNSTSSSLSI